MNGSRSSARPGRASAYPARRHSIQAADNASAPHRIAHLLDKLAGGNEHYRLEALQRLLTAEQRMQRGEKVRQRLAGACACPDDEIAACKGEWNGFGLNRRRLGQALLAYRPQQPRVQAQIGEGLHMVITLSNTGCVRA
jgi:hypothetical protein